MSCTGGPLGSTATIALIRFGRASATGQLNEPDCEWVSRIAGPILSSSATSASRLISCCLGKLTIEGNCEA
jgi:hypothetical protein